MTILDAARAIREKSISSAELTKQALDRISKLSGKLNAFITVTEELARDEARRVLAKEGECFAVEQVRLLLGHGV